MDEDPLNRRDHERYVATGQATLSWRGKTATGTVTNVSTEGMAVLVSEPIAVGQVVRLNMDGSSYVGSIRSCRDCGPDRLVGVQIAILNNDDEEFARTDDWLEG